MGRAKKTYPKRTSIGGGALKRQGSGPRPGNEWAEQKFFIAGRNPVLEALKAGTPLTRVIIAEETRGAILETIRRLAAEKGVPLVEVTRGEFRQYEPHEIAQGVLGIAAESRKSDLASILQLADRRNERRAILLLDQIEDPHNFGALVRTAECAGFHGVITPQHHSAPISPGTIKASAGATAYMPIAAVPNLVQAIETLKQHSFWIIGLDMSGSRSYTDVDYIGSVGVVVGNEGKGLRRLVREHCDHLVSIPLYGKIGSLNASVAGALVMYEVRRQRSSTHS